MRGLMAVARPSVSADALIAATTAGIASHTPGGRVPALRFGAEDSEQANEDWGANCGPHSLAAISGKTLEEVRWCLFDFRGYMTPTDIEGALCRLQSSWRRTIGLKTKRLCNGVNRIQFEGSWLNPGVNPKAAYAHTHWIAFVDGWVLCTAVAPALWLCQDFWSAQISAMGKQWHVTHHYALMK